MKIPSTLPQFTDQPSFILVTSTEEADFYYANNKEINNVSHLKLEKIKFSDHENSARFGSVAFETGSKSEQIKKINHQEFIKKFKKTISDLAKDFKVKNVYLFVPTTIKSDLVDALPAKLQKNNCQVYSGNFCKEKILVLLKKIKK